MGRGRYERGAAAGYRNGTRKRHLLGSFGPVEIAVPRARLSAADGTTHEWQSAVLPRYARMTRQVEALITAAYPEVCACESHFAQCFRGKMPPRTGKLCP